MTEGELQAEVERMCRRLLLCCYHPHNSRRDSAGFPDLVAAGQGGVIFRELKSAGGDTTAEQDLWGWTLTRAGADWGIWRPADLASGRIERELSAIASPGAPPAS